MIWQPTADGHKGRNQPAPMHRPGITREPDGERFRPKGRPVEEMRHLLDNWTAGRLERTHKPKGEKAVT